MKLGSWFAGTPEQLIEHLKALEKRYPGLEHINLSTSMGTPKSVMLEQFQWVAEAVMPAFRDGAPEMLRPRRETWRQVGSEGEAGR